MTTREQIDATLIEHIGWINPSIKLVMSFKEAGDALEALLSAERVEAQTQVIERILEAGNGETWDIQMAGAVGEVARIHSELTTLKGGKELNPVIGMDELPEPNAQGIFNDEHYD